MTVDFVVPELGSPVRVLLLGAATDAWYSASDSARTTTILPAFQRLVEDWRALGARILSTLDDDLFMVGAPGPRGFTWYILCDVERVETVAAMIQRVRESIGGVRMDSYVRFDARIGRPFFLAEER